MNGKLNLPGRVDIYIEGAPEGIDPEGLCRYLKDLFPRLDARPRGNPVSSFFYRYDNGQKKEKAEEWAERLAAARMRVPVSSTSGYKPLPGEIVYEKKKLLHPDEAASGVLYDGFELSCVFSGLLPPEESGLGFCRVVFTGRHIGSCDEGDLRCHARVAVFGFPTIISVSGIVEAPAKPRDFYLKSGMIKDPLLLKEEFRGRYVDYGDPEIGEAAKGYLMQAIFFHMTGVPFCEDRDCRLYNAHWQEELIRAQVKSGREFCPRHEEIIKKLR